ncbi:DUF1636 family protein [Ruegeria sp.]|uniref:DUF1636 family protein n=1 Tax=Ruegeria sp. TaxID=1879320 RepID=UPI003C7A45D6
MSSIPDHYLLVCAACKGTLPVENLRDGLAANLPSGFAIRMVDCMAGCDTPRTVGFQASGKAQYLFGDIQDARDLDALAEFAQQYCDSADGWTSATERPRALYTKTLSRMPPLEMEELP